MKRRDVVVLAAGIAGVSAWWWSSRGRRVDVDVEVAAERPAPPPAVEAAPRLAPGAPGRPMSAPVAVGEVVELPLGPRPARGDVREGRLQLEVPVREWSLDSRERFAFFDGVVREVELTSHEPIQDVAEGGTFVGRIAGAPGSWLVLSHVDHAVAGTVFVPGQGLYRVRTRAGGEVRLTLLDPAEFPDETAPLEPPPAPADEPPPVAADVNTTVDLLVVYTPAAATANGGVSGVTALINAAVTTANLSYTNSGVGVTLRVVRTQQTSYTESNAIATDLPRLTSTSDGHMDEVHAARAQVKADLVSLVVANGSDAAGVAYLWTPGNGGFAAWAFSVVVDDYADANLTLAHEVGHNMGCGHAQVDGGGAAYPYSYGWKFTGTNNVAYRTVMAYSPGIRIPYFSNPNVSYQGVATGRSESGANPAHNALSLTNARTSIAALVTGLTLADQQWIPITAGDFNADGKTDLVWRNASTGRVIVWLMDGATKTSTATLWSGDAAWVPITATDLNADGKTDLVWRNSATGRVIVWYLDGVTTTSTAALWTGDAAWVPITSADFNADGKLDLVWRNSSTGRVIVWFMNGATMTSTAALWTGDAAWVPVVARDLDGDGQTDLIWRNSSTGRVIAWLMNGVTTVSTTALWTGTSAWVPRAAGDYDGDGDHDIVWRNSGDGRVIIWFMNGTTMSSSTPIWQ